MSETITPLSEMGLTGMFGRSPVSLKQIGEGKEHKEARQAERNLKDLFLLLGVDHITGTKYLDHLANHTPYIGIEIGHRLYYLGIKKTAGSSESSTTPSNSIKIIGGTCIGGSETIMGIDETGGTHSLLESDVPDTLNTKVIGLFCNAKPTAYEVDTVIRTSGLIIAMLENGIKKPTKDLSMYWHVPFPEYVLYMKQYLESGVLSKDQCAELVDILGKKALVLKTWINNRLKPYLDNINLGSPLDMMMQELNILDDTCTLESVLTHLYCNPLWMSIIDNSTISTWTQLADVSYTYMYLQQNIQGEITLGVENPEEGKILNEAKKLAKQLGIPFEMVCLYPHPHFLENGTVPARLYRHRKTTPDEVLKIHKSY